MIINKASKEQQTTLTVRRATNSELQKEWEKNTSKLYYLKPCIKERESAHNSCKQFKVKLSRIRIGHTKLTHEHLMSRNNQQLTCGNAACGN